MFSQHKSATVYRSISPWEFWGPNAGCTMPYTSKRRGNAQIQCKKQEWPFPTVLAFNTNGSVQRVASLHPGHYMILGQCGLHITCFWHWNAKENVSFEWLSAVDFNYLKGSFKGHETVEIGSRKHEKKSYASTPH